MTDEGISGWSEAGLSYGNCREAAWGQCQDFAKLVIGMDPFNTEEIWEHLHRHTFWGMGGGVVVTSAMAAIDTACWDIKGKALNLPVYKLIGGKTNKKLRAYASQLQFGWRTLIEGDDSMHFLSDPQEYYDVTKDAIADGYDAIKIAPAMIPGEKTNFAAVAKTQGEHHRGCYRKHDLQAGCGPYRSCPGGRRRRSGHHRGDTLPAGRQHGFRAGPSFGALPYYVL